MNRRRKERVAVLVSALVGVVVAVGSVWLFSGTFDVFHEQLFRVGPTVEGQGVGADWETGNTVPWLNFLISLMHAADVIMGVFILVMVFLHWGAFRRLADRMQSPYANQQSGTVAADGGSVPAGTESVPAGTENEAAASEGEAARTGDGSDTGGEGR
ncbi:hypothetical protein [Halomarina litorea]|uniref:hypothetical protein n=1 Tax=Halomarina litorea TaxID=2961595 RepID=UPI0020C3ACF8|nr:hypothetical protein [Halomarina sp. BCD28]